MSVEIRLLEASKLATVLGTHYLNLSSAVLLRDKYSVRLRLAEKGIVQPEFELATTTQEIKSAVHKLGLPLLIKPSDGYGSQSVVVLQTQLDLDPLISPVEILLPSRADYGLGVVRATIGGVIDRLVKKGWVSRVVSQQDRRARELSLTAKGLSVRETLLPIVQGFQKDILSPLNSTDQSALIELIRQIVIAPASKEESSSNSDHG